MSEVAALPTSISQRLELYRQIIIEVMRKNNLEDADVARGTSIGRNHIGKVRRGERKLTAEALDMIIDNLGLDRQRLAFAVDIMGDPACYFDATFQKTCIFTHAILVNTVQMTKEGGGLSAGVLMASLSAERCATLAHEHVDQLREQFHKVGHGFMFQQTA